MPDCNPVAGNFDYHLKIRVRDMADFKQLHGHIARITGTECLPSWAWWCCL